MRSRREIADVCGLTTSGIRAKDKKLGIKPIKNGAINYYTEAQFARIINSMQQKRSDTDEIDEKVITLFTTLKDNSSTNIAIKLRIKANRVCKILEKYFKEFKPNDQFEIYESRINFEDI